MKYKPGTFSITPNKELLRGKPSEMIAVYFWICDYSDNDGVCYPSRKRLAEDSGCNIKTVDKYIKKLEELGLLVKTCRQKPNSKEKSSNIYQLMVGAETVLPSGQNGATPSTENGAVTIPTINYTHLTIESPSPDKLTLPTNRGNTPVKRLITIYRDLYINKYGKTDSLSSLHGQLNIIFGSIIKDLSEIQIAALLIIFFNWNGITGNDEYAKQKLAKAMYPIGYFKTGLPNYETYARNVLNMPFDDDKALLLEVAREMVRIKNEQSAG